jgi:tetratricopeptide (TPR) repeat protein
MASIIYILSSSSNKISDDLLQTLNDIATSNVTIIAESSTDLGNSKASLVPYDQDDLSISIREALRQANSDNVVIISESSTLLVPALRNLMNKADNLEDSSLIYAPTTNDENSEDYTTASSSSILSLITYQSDWSISAVACKKSLAQSALNNKTQSAIEVIARLIISATCQGVTITTNDPICNSISASTLSKSALARSLSLLSENSTIEELFPEHQWDKYSEESAAAAYHSLAALFIKLGDNQSAIDCVRLSEQFEESPRSWALKGLIASNKGETLGAVANLVSSLQQYEERKKSNSHYLVFEPNDLEVINSSLASGLEALNKRDNETALDFFAQAVFNFDNFYSRYGLATVSHKPSLQKE